MRDLSEIKFRIWDVLDKDWVEVGSGTLPQIALVFGKGGADFNTPMIAQQYLGVEDKNGKPMYEGDIVKLEDGELYKMDFPENYQCSNNKAIEVVGNCLDEFTYPNS